MDDEDYVDEVYTPPPYVNRETGTLVCWRWDDLERTTGSFVDTGREPTGIERFVMTVRPTTTPLLAMIGRTPRDRPKRLKWGWALPPVDS